MGSIFFRFYTGLLLALCILCASIYSITLVIERYRFEHFIESRSAGASIILKDILSRRSLEQQNEWLELFNKLSGSSLAFSSRSQLSLTSNELKLLAQKGFVQRFNFSEASAEIYIEISGRESEVIVANMADINDRVGRALMLIVMSGMRYRNIREEGTEFDLLSQKLGLPLSIMKTGNAGLTFAQARLIKRNEMVVRMSDKLGQGASVTVYAPLVRGGDTLLKLGEVKRFIWMPVGLAFLLIFSSLIILAVSAYLLILPVSRRMKELKQQVAALGVDNQQRVELLGSDDLSSLAETIDDMAQRILGLLHAQQEMTSAVSHELRTPIARMKFQLALLEDATENKFEDRITGLKQDILELEQLVDEVLTYASIKAREPSLVMAALDLPELINKAFKQTAELNKHASQLHFSLSNPQYIDSVPADEHFIMRAVMNVLTNAQRHANHKVNVTLGRKSGLVFLKVEDDGEGVSESFKENVFEAFSRGDQSRSKTSGGYGLGLAIVHQVMLWHKGSVIVEDSELGGAAFTLMWPAQR